MPPPSPSPRRRACPRPAPGPGPNLPDRSLGPGLRRGDGLHEPSIFRLCPKDLP